MSGPEIDIARADEAQLLVVDVQGKLARLMHDSDAMIRAQRVMIEACGELGVPIVCSEQLPDKLGETVAELREVLEQRTPYCKSSFGCMGDDALRQRIEDNGRGQVLLCGIEAHVCVWQTAASLIDAGYRVHLLADATSSRNAANRDVAIERMARAGVHLSNVEMALFELMGDATHPKFRSITKLIK